MGVVWCDHAVSAETEEELVIMAHEHGKVHMADHEAFQSEEFKIMVRAVMHVE